MPSEAETESLAGYFQCLCSREFSYQWTKPAPQALKLTQRNNDLFQTWKKSKQALIIMYQKQMESQRGVQSFRIVRIILIWHGGDVNENIVLSNSYLLGPRNLMDRLWWLGTVGWMMAVTPNILEFHSIFPGCTQTPHIAHIVMQENLIIKTGWEKYQIALRAPQKRSS